MSSPTATDLPKATYRQLGRSGLRVSVPILGCMSLGDSRWQPWVLNSDTALPLLKAAYDRGLNTWDTANVYSNGASEEIIGQALKHYGIPRHKVVIMTKCSGTVREGNDAETLALENIDARAEYVNQRGLSRQGIFNAVEASLSRLGTGYVDVLQIHRFDATTPIEETMEALHDLVKMGKVRYIGASSMWCYQFVMMQQCAKENGWTRFVSMQNFYGALYREEEREMNKYCNLTGVGLIPWSPLCGGLLARPRDTAPGSTERSKNNMFAPAFKGEADNQIMDRVEELAKKKGWTMTQVALSWVMEKGVSSPIVGLSSVERIDEAIAVGGLKLSEEEVKYIDEPYVAKRVIGF